MKISIKNIPNLKIPQQAKSGDAGYDVVAISEPFVVGEKIERPLDGLSLYKNINYIEYKTGLFITPNDELMNNDKESFHTYIFPRSSISKYNLVLANSIGLIDKGYRNEILVRFKYLPQPEDLIILPEAGVNKIYCIINQDKIYHANDKICQLVLSKTIQVTFQPVEELPLSERNMGGFGSSGS